MIFGGVFGQPFDEAPPVAQLREIWDCAIDGRPFHFDREHDAFKQGIRSIQAIREQADNSALPGEQSISRSELWRDGQQSWHKGAGQRYRDKTDSDPERFWASQGVDVWKKNEARLLHRTVKLHTTTPGAPGPTAPFPILARAGAYLYVGDGSTVKRSSDGVNWTPLPFATNTGNVTSIATNGFTVWVCTPLQTYSATLTSTTWTNWLTQPASGGYELVAFVNNRLVVTNEQFISEITGTNTVTQLNEDEGNTNWRWTSITDGTSAIYAAGVSGNRSQVFSIRAAPSDPGGALGPPIPAAPSMPNGEGIRYLYSYLGLLAMGTDQGIRVAQKITDYAGREIVSIGSLIRVGDPDVGQPVFCFDGEGQYLWFGWTNFDSTTTGIGRLNLAQETEPGVFAYASDLMAEDTGIVTSIASLNGLRYFAVSGKGIYAEGSDYVDSGWLQSGLVRYQVIDPKVAERVEVSYAAPVGTVEVALSADGGDFVSAGISVLDGSSVQHVTFSTLELVAENSFDVKTILTSSDAGTPVIQHVELRSAVVPIRGETIMVPLRLELDDSDTAARHPSDDYEFLRQRARYKHTISYQEQGKIFRVIAEDYQFERSSETIDNKWWNGTFVLALMAPAP